MKKYKDIENAAKPLNDRFRKSRRIGSKTLVPHKFDENGNLLTKETFDMGKHLARLSPQDLEFVEAWREEKWDFDKACARLKITASQGHYRRKKVEFLQTEEKIILAKAKIPTPSYILAKDLDNVEGIKKIEDTEHKSLDRMAKILGAFKTTEVNTQINILQMPKLSDEDKKKAREFYDTIAIEDTRHVA